MAPLLRLPEVLSDFRLDPDAVIREVGCDPELFGDPANTIDFAAVGRLLDHTARVTGYAFPGLELGRRSGLEAVGALAPALRRAPDLGTALRTLILYFHLHTRGGVPSLWEGKSQAMCGYTLLCPDVPGSEHIYDGALAIIYNLIGELFGEQWTPVEVRLFRDKPTDAAPFRRHFRAGLRFGVEQAAIVFRASDLTRPLAESDPDAYARALRELDEIEPSEARLLGQRIRRLLHRLFVSGAGPDGIDLKQIALLFSLHPRTLNRRLRQEQTSFRALLAAVRYDTARQLLRDTHLTVTEVAFILGYSSTSAFNTAFRRWSGATPRGWRSLHRRL